VVNKDLLLQYLECRRKPPTRTPEAVPLHRALCAAAPAFYLRLLADPVAEIGHKREALANLVCQAPPTAAGRRQILTALRALPAAEAVRVLDVLCARRVNRRRARELGLAFLLGHEQLCELAATRRQRLVRLLKHFLGERTWSSVRRALASATPEAQAFLRAAVLRHAADEDAARQALCFLAGVSCGFTEPHLVKSAAARQALEQGEGLPRETLLGLRGIFHRQAPVSKVRSLSATAPRAERQDGPLTALCKEALRDGVQMRHGFELPTHLERVRAALPALAGRLAVVLDLSASAASSGERSHHPAALGLALTHVLRECVAGLSVHPVGGTASLDECPFPAPQGETDLATAVLAAAREEPDAILIVTDGYENVRPGDVDAVVRGLRRLDRQLPVYQVVPLFTPAEDLSRRRLSEAVPVLPVSHEAGVGELLARVLLSGPGDAMTPSDLERLQRLLFVP
jgi:hypothetical protein